MNALQIMEYAVNQGGSDYQFTATYFKDLGFFIDKLNGTASTKHCHWFVYIGSPDGCEKKSDVGVSSLDIPISYSLIMKFEQ